MITSILTLAIALIGLTSGILIFRTYTRLTDGIVRKLMFWLVMTVLLCGFPYALWNFSIEAGFVAVPNPDIPDIMGSTLVTFFFLFMLQASLVARKIGKEFGFGADRERIKKALEEAP